MTPPTPQPLLLPLPPRRVRLRRTSLLPRNSQLATRNSSSPRAFTFTEIMFAVVILGIGFIMIAAVFPVAIRMNSQSAEETQGAVIASRATQVLQGKASDALFPVSYSSLKQLGIAYDQYSTVPYPPFIGLGEARRQLGSTGRSSALLAGDTWSAFRADMISATDARNGFAVAYARSGPASNSSTGQTGSPLIKIIIVTTQVRGERQNYNDQDTILTDPAGSTKETVWGKDTKIPPCLSGDTPPYSGKPYLDGMYTTPTNTPATLQFKRFEAAFQTSTTGTPDLVHFTRALTGDLTAAGEGAYVILANVNANYLTNPTATDDANTNAPPILNGRIFRLGRDVSTASLPNTYELVTGQDMLTVQNDMSTTGTTTDLARFKSYFNESNLASPTNTVEVLVLGKMLRDPTQVWNAATNPYVGKVQDMSVYSTIIGLQK